MAAELDYRSNGQAAIFSVGSTPWHKEGTILTAAPSIADGLVLAGLDFTVETRPIFWQPADATYAETPKGQVSVRTDRNEVLGVVGPGWTPLQNRDAFAIVEPLIDSGVATLETAGSLRGGEDVWVMVRFNREKMADENESIGAVFDRLGLLPFGTIMNNHSGRRSVVVAESTIRVVCRNTLGMALDAVNRKAARGVKLLHTLNVEQRTTEAVKSLWSDVIERFGYMAEQYDLLSRTYFEEAQFRVAVLDVLAPLPEMPTDGEKPRMFDAMMERANARRERLTYLWSFGDGHTGDGSAWEALNAAVQSLDHDRDVWGSPKAGVVQSLVDGTLGRMKDSVTSAVVKEALALANA